MIQQFVVIFTMVVIPALIGGHLNRIWFLGLTMLYVLVWFALIQSVRGGDGGDGATLVLLLFVAGTGLAVAGGIHVVRFVARRSRLSRTVISALALIGSALVAAYFMPLIQL